MKICKTCNKRLSLSDRFNCLDEHKECETKRMDEWVKNHKFVFGEKVNIIADDFHIETRQGVVVDKGADIEGAWGYYSASEWYKVKIGEKEIKFAPEQLAKL
jgi:hypothetical protein